MDGGPGRVTRHVGNVARYAAAGRPLTPGRPRAVRLRFPRHRRRSGRGWRGRATAAEKCCSVLRVHAAGERDRRLWRACHSVRPTRQDDQRAVVSDVPVSLVATACFLTVQSVNAAHPDETHLARMAGSRDIPCRPRTVTFRRACCAVTAVAGSVSRIRVARSSSRRTPKKREVRHAAGRRTRAQAVAIPWWIEGRWAGWSQLCALCHTMTLHASRSFVSLATRVRLSPVGTRDGYLPLIVSRRLPERPALPGTSSAPSVRSRTSLAHVPLPLRSSLRGIASRHVSSSRSRRVPYDCFADAPHHPAHR